MGITQVELAERLRVSQTALSHMENRADLRISTLRAYAEAAGGSLEIRVTFPDSVTFQLVGSRLTLRPTREPADNQEADTLDDARQLCFPGIGENLPPKDVVLSVRPKHAENILVGAKTVELRRRFTEEIGHGSRAFIYSTSPISALRGFAKIGAVHRMPVKQIWQKHRNEARIRKPEFEAYFSGCEQGYAIFLNTPQLFPKALSLTELRVRFGFEPPQSFLYAPPGLVQFFGYERLQVPH
jgi:predicted transcriptional regulator